MTTQCDKCGREGIDYWLNDPCNQRGIVERDCPGHFRPIQPQGSCEHTASKVITPEPGRAYVDAQGRVALHVPSRRDQDGIPWVAASSSHHGYEWMSDFTPVARLVPESQPRGSVVTEADIEAAMKSLPYWSDHHGVATSDILRKHFLNKSTPSDDQDWTAKYEEAMRAFGAARETAIDMEQQRDAALSAKQEAEKERDDARLAAKIQPQVSLDRYPNLDAVMAGCVSGSPSEWPMIRREIVELTKERDEARAKLMEYMTTSREDRDARIRAEATIVAQAQRLAAVGAYNP